MIMAYATAALEHDSLPPAILVSDDDSARRRTYRLNLHSVGFPCVFTAATTATTLQLIERVVPDLVITDMVKPDAERSGEQIALAVRASNFLCNVHVVLASAWPATQPGWHSLFDGFLPVPFTSMELSRTVRTILRGAIA